MHILCSVCGGLCQQLWHAKLHMHMLVDVAHSPPQPETIDYRQCDTDLNTEEDRSMYVCMKLLLRRQTIAWLLTDTGHDIGLIKAPCIVDYTVYMQRGGVMHGRHDVSQHMLFHAWRERKHKEAKHNRPSAWSRPHC